MDTSATGCDFGSRSGVAGLGLRTEAGVVAVRVLWFEVEVSVVEFKVWGLGFGVWGLGRAAGETERTECEDKSRALRELEARFSPRHMRRPEWASCGQGGKQDAKLRGGRQGTTSDVSAMRCYLACDTGQELMARFREGKEGSGGAAIEQVVQSAPVALALVDEDPLEIRPQRLPVHSLYIIRLGASAA